MTASRQVGFAITGCGMIAGVHAGAIAASNGGRLVGVHSRSADRARAFAEKHDAVVHTTDLAALLAHPEVDAVCVTTPSGAHLDPAVAAASAGKHVVVEKPLEVTVARAAGLVRACEENGVRLAAIFQARFGPGARAVKQVVASGRLGRLTLCGAEVKWYRDQAYYDEGGWKGTVALDGGGALMNQAIHAVDLLQSLAGMPATATAMTATLAHERIEVEDTAVACLRFPHGALGTIQASTAAYPGFARAVELCGEHGTVRLEDDRIACWRFHDERSDDADIRARLGTANEVASGASDPKQTRNAGHEAQIQDLIHAILEDRPPRVDGREALKAVAIIEAVYASARHGQEQEIELPWI